MISAPRWRRFGTPSHHPERRDTEFAKDTALNILSRKYAQFRQELNDTCDSGHYGYKLDVFGHAIDVLQRYFEGNPGGLTERLPV